MRIIEKKIVCAYCGKESTQKVLLSYSSFGPMDLDTRPAPNGRRVLPYKVQECPHCHYCNSNIENKKIVPISLDDNYSSIVADESIDDVPKKYYLLGYLQSQNSEHYKAGMSYLNAAWFYDDLKNDEQATFFRKKAAQELSQHALKKDDGDAALILLDIFRRIGEFEEAKGLIEWLGETGEKELDRIIQFQKNLIERTDTKAHNMSEVE